MSKSATEDNPTATGTDSTTDPDDPTSEADSKASSTEAKTQSTTLFDDEIYEYDTEGNLPEDITREFNPDRSVDLQSLLLPETEIIDNITPPWQKVKGNVDDMDNTVEFTGSITIDTLDLVIQHINPIVSETKVAITEEGWYIHVVNPANTVMAECWISQTDFQEYTATNTGIIGIDIGQKVGDMVDLIDRETTTNIEITTPEEKNPTITFDDGIEMTAATIDPDAMRSEPGKFNDSLTSSLTITGLNLRSLTKRINNFSDTTTISVKNANKDSAAIEITGQGDTTEISKTIDQDNEWIIDTDLTATNQDVSMFKNQYILDIFKGLRKNSLKHPYPIKFGEEQPLEIARKLSEDSHLKFKIAPHVD